MKIGKIAKSAKKLSVIKVSQTEFEVLDQVMKRDRHYVMDLKQIYCEREGWEINWINNTLHNAS